MKRNLKYIFIFAFLFSVGCNQVLAEGFSSKGVVTACGFDMPDRIPPFTSGIYNLIKIAVPIILIIMGMVDFLSAVMASEEKKMKDSQKKFITRLIAAVIIFFIMAIVQFVFREIVKTGDEAGVSNCMNCLLSNKGCGSSTSSDSKMKSCSDYKENECPERDSSGKICKKENGKCVSKKYCEDYTGSCPPKDDYGNNCHGDANSSCKRATCSTLSLDECKGSFGQKNYCEIYQTTCRKKCSAITDSSECMKTGYCTYGRNSAKDTTEHCFNK